jgi:hypothetical protein
MTTQRTFPYRRDIRPASPEGLGEHSDREFEKIETAIAALAARIAALEP